MVQELSDEDRAAEVARIMSDEELSQAEKIEALMALGYSAQQLEKGFGFKHATVYQTTGKMVKPAQRPEVEDWGVPAKLDRYQMIPPEQALQRIHLQDGEYKQGFIDGISILLLAGRYNQMMAATQSTMMDPMIKLVQAMKQEERDAAERSRGEGQAIAQQAAGEATARVAEYFDKKLTGLEKAVEQRKPDIATVPNPLQGVMARVLETTLAPMVEKMMAGLILRPSEEAPMYRGGTPSAQTQPLGQGSSSLKEGGVIETNNPWG